MRTIELKQLMGMKDQQRQRWKARYNKGEPVIFIQTCVGTLLNYNQLVQRHTMTKFESKKRYSKISYIKRVKLIDLIEKQGYGVTKAARQLRVKIPTAKVILSNYRKKGHIYLKKNDKTVPKQAVEENVPTVKEESNILEDVQVREEVYCPQPITFCPIYYWAPFPNYSNMIMF